MCLCVSTFTIEHLCKVARLSLPPSHTHTQHTKHTHSYHQKYLLRQQRDVLNALNLSEKELVSSHVAARLNGYCGGYGTLEALDGEMTKFDLPENVQKRVRGIVSRKTSY